MNESKFQGNFFSLGLDLSIDLELRTNVLRFQSVYFSGTSAINLEIFVASSIGMQGTGLSFIHCSKIESSHNPSTKPDPESPKITKETMSEFFLSRTFIFA